MASPEHFVPDYVWCEGHLNLSFVGAYGYSWRVTHNPTTSPQVVWADMFSPESTVLGHPDSVLLGRTGLVELISLSEPRDSWLPRLSVLMQRTALAYEQKRLVREDTPMLPHPPEYYLDLERERDALKAKLARLQAATQSAVFEEVLDILSEDVLVSYSPEAAPEHETQAMPIAYYITLELKSGLSVRVLMRASDFELVE